ncbi:ABC transporter permease subunit [Acuticoccus sp. MNP-M23]|uniref:amino acid ABC transporter permease n=1 Tax=Acuticoccus sp. MNP-M23 TaxID=3072793 RepID=UPI0028153444|nr:ABC transporter permease subunit [Acuticoccus sp. MNP-M23]WMS40883.1 ABC transporter permease subunit [Acuticoccus sp. MNP-M23]
MLRALKNRKARGWLLQGATLAIAILLVATFVLTARHNLLSQGIATGFGFLERSTGWPINFSLIDISDRSPYWEMLLAGFLNTLLVGILGITLATVIGVTVGLARVSTNFMLNFIGTVFVEIFRNVPLILQVIFWYALLTHLPRPREAYDIGGAIFLTNRGLIVPAFDMSSADIALFCAGFVALVVAGVVLARRIGGLAATALVIAASTVLFLTLLYTGRTPDAPVFTLPAMKGLRFAGGFDIKPEFFALLVSIAIFGGAYVGEIVRAGFLSVDQGRVEAARALGLSGWQVNRFVRIPLAVRAILPALSNQYIWLMKATTLGIAIGFPDYFMVVSTSINQSGQTMELLALLMGGFLVINYAMGAGLNILNGRLTLKGRN